MKIKKNAPSKDHPWRKHDLRSKKLVSDIEIWERNNHLQGIHRKSFCYDRSKHIGEI